MKNMEIILLSFSFTLWPAILFLSTTVLLFFFPPTSQTGRRALPEVGDGQPWLAMHFWWSPLQALSDGIRGELICCS